MSWSRIVVLALFGAILFHCVLEDAEARKRRKRRRLRIPTHPIYLWAKTISESKDDDQRKVAAFKLSQYSQPIYQVPVINALLGCAKDKNLHIKVLCTKSLGRARKRSKLGQVKNVLIQQYKSEPFLRNTVVRTFIVLRATDSRIQKMLMKDAKSTKKPGELLVLMSYFEQYGNGSNRFVNDLVAIYHKHKDTRVRTAVVKALGETANGQQNAIDLLAECTTSSDTPLVLTCLAGLENQGTKSRQAWQAVENTIKSSDPDVLEASLDVIEALPEQVNDRVASRLLQIVSEAPDSELKEKAVLGLGVCGNKSEDIVELLQKLVEEQSVGEDIRIAAALVLGKQAALFPDRPKRILGNCGAREKSQNLRTACQLGLQELKTRTATKKRSRPTKRSTASKRRKQE